MQGIRATALRWISAEPQPGWIEVGAWRNPMGHGADWQLTPLDAGAPGKAVEGHRAQTTAKKHSLLRHEDCQA